MSILTASRLLVTPEADNGLGTLTCTGAASPNIGSYGSWVEFIASTAAETTIAGLYLNPPAVAAVHYVFQFGVGAGGAEVAIGEQAIFMPTSGNHFQCTCLLETPIGPIAAGTRVSIRVRSGSTVTTDDAQVSLLYYEDFDSTHRIDGVGGVELINYAPVDIRGRTVAGNATPYAPSAWAELVSSFAADGVLVGVSVAVPSGTNMDGYIVELGTGAAAAETAITTIRFTAPNDGVGGADYNVDLPAPFPVAAGTRVSYRIKKAGVVTANTAIWLRYLGDVSLAEPIQKVTQQALLAWFNDVDTDAPDVDACTGGGEVPTGTNPGAGEDLSAATAPIPWIAITVEATTYRYAAATVPHSPPRAGLVQTFGKVQRMLSEPDSGPRSATLSVSLVDTGRTLRALANAGTLKHALFEAFISDLSTIVAGGIGSPTSTGFRVFRGRIAEWSAEPDLLFTLTAEDELTARLTSIDAADLQLGRALLDGVSDDNPEEKTFGKPAPEVYGNVSDEDEDEPKGVWQLPFSSAITFPEAEELGNNYVFPICVGPVGQVQAVFGASPFEDPPVSRVKLPASAFGDWLWVVTMTGWFGANDYYVDGSLGYRWALVVIEDGHPTAEMARDGRIPITVNVCGYEETGDATGATINSFPRGMLHWMNARLLQDNYGDNDWPTTIFALGDHSLIDTTTFEAVHEYLDDLGYVLGGVLGWNLAFESWRDRWAQWLRHMGYDAATGYNRHGQVILVKLDRSSEHASAPRFTLNEILDRGCRVQNRDDAVENLIRYVSQQNYRTQLQGLNPAEGERGRRDPYDGPWLYLPEAVQNNASISDLGGDPRGVRQSNLQEYGLTRDTATADALAEERLDWCAPANGRPQIDFDLSLRDGWDLELGDVIYLEHPDLVWSDAQRCQVRGLELDLDQLVITVTVWYVDDLLP